MALRICVHLGRPGFYVLNQRGRDAAPADTLRAVHVAKCALGALLVPLFGIAALTELAR